MIRLLAAHRGKSPRLILPLLPVFSLMDPLPAKLVAASCGSTMTALTMTPFDVVKTRLQTQPPRVPSSRSSLQGCCLPSNQLCVRNMSSLARAAHAEGLVCVWDHGTLRTERVTGFSDAVRKVWQVEGIRGLWKGAGTTLLIGVPSSTFYMLTYDYFAHTLIPSLSLVPTSAPSLVTPLLAGVLARSFISSVVSPLELIRTNLQSTPPSPEHPHTLSSVFRDIRRLVRSQGGFSLWRGLAPTLWRDVPFSGIYWAGYESCKQVFEKNGHHGPLVAFTSGSLSGTTAALMTNPFDVLKTRRQAFIMGESVRQGAPISSFAVLRQILNTEGVKALFAGLTPRMAKIAPACGIMIACYEGIGSYLTKPPSHGEP